MDIIQLTKSFTELAEWQRFCEAQYKQIISLTKQNNEFKEKIKNLEEILGKSTSLIQDPTKKQTTIQSIAGLSDEEAIAIMEIAKLKEISLERPLDPAETKQYETYTKTLQLLKQQKKEKQQAETAKLSDEQILRLVENPE